jgi:hypothetical protein
MTEQQIKLMLIPGITLFVISKVLDANKSPKYCSLISEVNDDCGSSRAFIQLIFSSSVSLVSLG